MIMSGYMLPVGARIRIAMGFRSAGSFCNADSNAPILSRKILFLRRQYARATSREFL